jgi:hypothetical protein
MVAVLAYAPFLDALPIWVKPWFWPLLLLPLCAAVAIVYKSIRCREMHEVPRESFILFLTIVLGMMLTGAALVGLASLIQ